jgi:hypothetical protein
MFCKILPVSFEFTLQRAIASEAWRKDTLKRELKTFQNTSLLLLTCLVIQLFLT